MAGRSYAEKRYSDYWEHTPSFYIYKNGYIVQPQFNFQILFQMNYAVQFGASRNQREEKTKHFLNRSTRRMTGLRY